MTTSIKAMCRFRTSSGCDTVSRRVWYTVDGFYTFTFTYFYGGLPYQHYGSFRILLTQKEEAHE